MTIDRITAGSYSRSELVKLRENAVTLLKKGDAEVQPVIEAIDQASPTDKSMIFMGFCPNADLNNRLDIGWREKGICTFIFHDDKKQTDRFNSIWPGDLIILKKRQQIGKTMTVSGHGRVTGVKYDAQGHRYLVMDWSAQEQTIEVPLMGANATVNVRTIEKVEAEMPEDFFRWLYGKPA